MSALRFPSPPRPEISIVVVSYGGTGWTRRCLRALLDHTDPCYELILVDNPTDEGNADLPEVENARLLFNPVNVGFGAACNQGAAHATGRHLLFLNNDVLVHEGWLPPLLAAFGAHPGTGAAGPRFLNLDGSLQEAGALLSRGGSTLAYGADDDPDRPEFRFPRQVDYLSAACLLVRRSAFCDVGGFDAGYGLAYFEDCDLCLSLAAAGWHTAYEPRSRVTHARDAAGGSLSLRRLALANRSRFEERWRAVLTARPSPPLAGDRRRILAARDACSTAHLLVVAQDRELLVELRRELPRARLTAVLQEDRTSELDSLLALGIEVEEVDDWDAWLGERLFGFDAVFGAPLALGPALQRTQPQAVRIAPASGSALRDALAAAGIAPEILR
ncbi:MAG TPA: glycosyltransferase family 2 protein [Thermoanaerobaculia bacterium]|nr:glycosyltransferase family 2 protein [Thermoanaerobaculia bacterium]